MKLAIMTRGRVGKQTTLRWIPPRWRKDLYLVVSAEEEHSHQHQTLVTPPSVTNYSQKFQWILDGTHPTLGSDSKVVILDDDLVFSTYHMNGKLVTQKDPEHIGPMFDQIEALLDDFPLVGVHPRQNAQNSHEMRYVKNGRIICIQGINRSVVGKVKVDQFPILADVVLNCTLLARGQSNAIITSYFQDHGPCQAPGGCSIYRTAEMQHNAINYLAQRFPGYVKAVHRMTKGANWLGEKGRTDYVAQWKRLNAAGVAHLLDPGTVPHPDKEAVGTTITVE